MRHAFILAAIVLCLPLVAFAQEASIVGTVTDPSGSVVPNVKITITSAETGLVRTITTNDVGQYVVPDLHVGHYSVKAEASGFKTAQQKDVVLQVGDRLRLDFQMQLGGATETVTVEANAVRVQTDSGERSNVITSQQVSQLAVNGRSIYQLAALAPGASSQINNYVNTPVGGDAGVEFNGLRQNHNIYLLDGGEDDDRGGAGGMSIAPSSDAIGEFRQLTSNYSADYGLSSGGTMTMVLKSGTSTLHASAWEFNRNDALDARFFFNPTGSPVAKLNLNVYGFNVGGPVTLGKLYNPEKKKTFFFYNMEWRKLIQGNLNNGQPVPLTSTYGGVFDASLTTAQLHTPCTNQVSTAIANQFAGAGQTLSTPDPATGACDNNNGHLAVLQPFTNNTIPTSLLDGNAQALLNAGIFPAPTSGNLFQGSANAPTDLREEIVRIDHNFSSKFSVFGHFVAEQVSQGFAISQWSGANVPTVGDTFGNPSYSGVIHTTYMISPTLLNEVAFNYNGNRINIIPFAGAGLASLSIPAGYDDTNTRIFTGPNNLDRIPNIDLNGGTGTHFEISSWPWRNKADDYQIRDDVSWTHGAHQFRMGASWALYKKVQDLFGQTQGGFGFDGTFTGNDFADFLLGEAKSYQELGVQDKGLWNNVSWAAYFQDNWRVSNKLTLNLGLRWDGVPHTYEANNRMGNFYPSLYDPALAATFNDNGTICASDNPVTDPGCSGPSPGLGTSPNPILAGVPMYLNGIGIPGQNGVPKGLVNNHWASFGPRIGFAYDPTGSGKTVIRGGFGIMYERIQGNDMYNAGPNIPFSFQLNSSAPVELDNPSIALATGTAAVLPINPAGITGLAIDDYNQPASYQYSIGVQRQLSPGSVLSVAYVGNQNRHQNDYAEFNLPDQSFLPLLEGGAPFNTAPGLTYPGYNSIKLSANEANSHYNSLQIDLNSRIGHDLTFHAYYTLSRTIDPTSAGSGGGDLGSVGNPYAGWVYDVGPSGYDRTHNAAVNFIYEIPLFRNNSSKFVRSTIGGWEVSGIITMTSGLPINPQLTGGIASNGLPNTTNRPDVNGSVDYVHGDSSNPSDGHPVWFTDSAFTAPAAGTFGNAGRNSLRGPGRDNWNISLFKNFMISEARGSRFEFRIETFNTWNHTQFNQVSNGLGSSNFGEVTSTFDPRIFQLGAKLYF